MEKRLTKKQIREQYLMKIESDLQKAYDEAFKAYKTNDEDGGTCNFDSVLVKLDITQREADGFDYHCEKIRSGWSKGYFMINYPLYGQGNLRTRMAETACKELRGKGYEAMVWYEMD